MLFMVHGKHLFVVSYSIQVCIKPLGKYGRNTPSDPLSVHYIFWDTATPSKHSTITIEVSPGYMVVCDTFLADH